MFLRWQSNKDTQYGVLSSQNSLIRCKYVILEDLLKKMTSTYTLGAPNGETLPCTNKMPYFTCYFELSLFECPEII